MAGGIVMVDAGGTNLGSVRYALERLGINTELSSNASVIGSAERVLLPGVGAAGPGMRKLHEAGLVDVIRKLEQPVLGICLGMQLLFEGSSEAPADTLGVIPGRLERFGPQPGLRVPHMGWNRLEEVRDDPLLHGLGQEPYAYFVHSYRATLGPHTIASSLHGGHFTAAVRHRNFWGTQFHPERSAAVGARIFRNFLEIT